MLLAWFRYLVPTRMRRVVFANSAAMLLAAWYFLATVASSHCRHVYSHINCSWLQCEMVTCMRVCAALIRMLHHRTA